VEKIIFIEETSIEIKNLGKINKYIKIDDIFIYVRKENQNIQISIFKNIKDSIPCIYLKQLTME